MNHAALADGIRDADDAALWRAIGHDVQEAATETDAEYVALSFVISPDMYEYHLDRDADVEHALGRSLAIASRLSGGSEDVGEIFEDRDVDAHAVFRAKASGAEVDVVRRRLADAIEDAD